MSIQALSFKSFRKGFTSDSDNDHLAALYALLGGYNEVGRVVPLERYQVLKDTLMKAIWDMEQAMHEGSKRTATRNSQ